MFGLTKREQRWKAEQQAVEVLAALAGTALRAAADVRVAEARTDADELARQRTENTELRERNAAWWALVMGAAAALEDAANCLSDADAKKAAEGAAKHYRQEANALWPNAEFSERPKAGPLE